MVSVIVPVYNTEKYLVRCIESIMHQTYKEIEIILIDDGSTDKSFEICRYYSDRFDIVKAIHIENHGVSFARNYGIDLSAGEYIQFVDSDDYIEPNMIQKLLEEQETRKSDIVLCGYYREKIGNVTTQIIPNEFDYSFSEFDKVIAFWCYDPIIGSPCNKLFRAKILKMNNIRFREGMNYGEDFCFCMEYYRYIDKYSSIPEALYHYRDTPNSLTKKNAVEVGKLWNDQKNACNSIFKLVKCKGLNVENSEGAKQAFSYMCTLNFYSRLKTYGLFESIKWFRRCVSKSKYHELINKTEHLSRVGKLNYVFKVLKLMNAI